MVLVVVSIKVTPRGVEQRRNRAPRSLPRSLRLSLFSFFFLLHSAPPIRVYPLILLLFFFILFFPSPTFFGRSLHDKRPRIYMQNCHLPFRFIRGKKRKKRKQYNKMEDALAVAVTCGRLCAERNNNNRGWWMRDNLRSQLANCLMDKKNREDWASLVTSMHPALRWASPSGSRWTELSPPSPVFTFERHFRGRILHTCACLFRTRPFFLSEQLFFFYSIGSFIFLNFFFCAGLTRALPCFTCGR